MSMWRVTFWYWLPVLAYMATIYHYSTLTPGNIPGYVPGCDKLLHGIGYALLAWLWIRLFARHRRRPTWTDALAGVTIASLYGAAIEWRQIYCARSFEVADIVANTVGGALGALAYLGWREATARWRQQEH